MSISNYAKTIFSLVLLLITEVAVTLKHDIPLSGRILDEESEECGKDGFRGEELMR